MKLTFAEPLPALVAVLAAIVTIGLVVWAWKSLKAPVDRRGRRLFLTLRLMAALLLLALILEPVLSRDRLRTDDLSVLVLLDRSRSMSVPDSYGGRPRYKVAADFLYARETGLVPLLGDDFEIVTLAFDTKTRTADAGERHGDVSPTGHLTDLSAALSAASDAVPRAETVAVVLLTDGAENAGGDARIAAKDLGTPIYTIGFGSRGGGKDGRRDLALTRVNAPETAFADNTVVAEVSVRSTGYDLADPGNKRVRVVLREGETELASEWIEFKGGGAPDRVSLKFVPRGNGPHTFTVEVPLRGDESIPDNNRRTFGLEVLDRRASVLYFDATLRWEAKFLRDFLSRDPATDLTSVLHSGRGRLLVKGAAHGADLTHGLPATAEGFAKFDVIILGDVAAGELTEAQLKLLAARIEQGGGLLTLGGYNAYGPGGYADTPLSAALPVFLDATDGQIEEEVKLTLTPEGRIHPMLSGLGPTFGGADRPTLRGLTRVGREKPGAQILLTAEGANNSGTTIVLAAHRYGEGRVLSFTGDTSWVWHRSRALGGEDGFYRRYWGQALRWLLEREPEVTRGEDALFLDTDKPTYRIGEPIRIRARVRDKDGAPITDANLIATIEPVPETLSEGGALEFLPLPRVPGAYEAKLRATQPGSMRIDVTASRGGTALGTASESVLVTDTSVEMDQVDLDDERLAAIARVSGGRYYHAPPTAQDLDRDIRGSLVGLVEHQELSLSNTPLFFLLFVALLTAEWVLRRRRNLL